MIVGCTDLRPSIDGVILIDCWEPDPDKIFAIDYTNQFYKDLTSHLQQYNLQSVINHPSGFMIDYSDRSITNTLSRYSWRQTDKLLNIHARQIVIHEFLDKSGQEHLTSDIIKKSILDNEYSFCLGGEEGFYYHWKKVLNQSVNHWLVTGQAWQYCTHNNGLGLRALAKISQVFGINFYATHCGFMTNEGHTLSRSDFENDQLQWIEISEFGYQLVPVVADPKVLHSWGEISLISRIPLRTRWL